MTIESNSLGFGLQRLALEEPSQIALKDGIGSGEYTYSDLIGLISRFEYFFQHNNIDHESVVMSCMPNSVEQLVTFLSVASTGRTFAPVSTESTRIDLESWINLVKPDLCIIPWGAPNSLVELLNINKIAFVKIEIGSGFGWLPEQESSLKFDEGKLYVQSGGSSGNPRAVVFNTDVLWSSASAFTDYHSFLNTGSCFLGVLPMSYLGGLFNLGLIPLSVGASIAVIEPWSGRSVIGFWQNIDQYDVNIIWLLPGLLKALLDTDEITHRQKVAGRVHSLRACFVGMTPIDLETKNHFEKQFGVPVLENYGLSETTFLASETITSRARRLDNSSGSPLPWVELKFLPIDSNDKGPGYSEILAKTSYMCSGYLKSDGAIENPVDDEGFFSTLDSGYLDTNGSLHLTGRLGDYIKKGDELISLRDLEQFAERYESINEAGAFSLPHHLFGEVPFLFISFISNVADSGKELRKFRPWFHSNMPKSHWPEKIMVIDKFPLTSAGKKSRHLLKIHYLEQEK